MHVIDVARVAHETSRRFFRDQKPWAEITEQNRQYAISDAQAILDDDERDSDPSDGQGQRLFSAVVNALRPFVEG